MRRSGERSGSQVFLHGGLEQILWILLVTVQNFQQVQGKLLGLLANFRNGRRLPQMRFPSGSNRK
jgi:hypothetical protein